MKMGGQLHNPAFTSKERASSTHWIGGWMGLGVSLDILKISYFCMHFSCVLQALPYHHWHHYPNINKAFCNLCNNCVPKNPDGVTVWIKHNFLLCPWIRPLQTNTIITSRFSPSFLIGQQAIHIKASGITWDQSKSIECIKLTCEVLVELHKTCDDLNWMLLLCMSDVKPVNNDTHLPVSRMWCRHSFRMFTGSPSVTSRIACGSPRLAYIISGAR
jgi:hypothetical protein